MTTDTGFSREFVSRLHAEIEEKAFELERLRAENATLRAKLEAAEKKLATMVCGECKGSKIDPRMGMLVASPTRVTMPCPVCQPKGET